MAISSNDNRGLAEALLGDGRFLLSLTGMALLLGGVFAVAQSMSGQLLPHDMQALGMDAAMLRQKGSANLVRFMFHDRVAFGGTLLAIGIGYVWLAEFPMREGAAWAYWTFTLSGSLGFLSFLAYLGYGYLDTWHGKATLLLLPVYLAGMWRARKLVAGPLTAASIWKIGSPPGQPGEGIGRKLLLFIALGLVGGGIAILFLGMTSIFVPPDLVFIGFQPAQLREISPVLLPLLAHDRVGLGGGVFSLGLLLVMMLRHASLSRSFVEVIAVMGSCGFITTLGVHFAIGYTDFMHLSPVYVGFIIFAIGTAMLARSLTAPRSLTAST